MSINQEMAAEAEKRARRICRERGQPESLWQMALTEAYEEITEDMIEEPTDE